MVKVKILKTTGFSKSDLNKIKLAEEILNIVINSDTYKNLFLAQSFTETNGKTNQEIYDQLISGDCLFTDADDTIDLKLVMYYRRWSKVVGYVNGSPLTIFINRKFFSTPISIASNLLHEYFHLMGFSHNDRWETSLSYLAGNELFEFAAKKLGLDKIK